MYSDRLPLRSLAIDLLSAKSLTLGWFSASSVQEAMDTAFIEEESIRPLEKSVTAGKSWKMEANVGGRYVLHQQNQTGLQGIYVSYFSYWVYSPISLDDLMGASLDLPQLDKFCYVSDDCKLYLNGKLLEPAASEPADYRVRRV